MNNYFVLEVISKNDDIYFLTKTDTGNLELKPAYMKMVKRRGCNTLLFNKVALAEKYIQDNKKAIIKTVNSFRPDKKDNPSINISLLKPLQVETIYLK